MKRKENCSYPCREFCADDMPRVVARVVGRNADLTEDELFEDLEVAYGVEVPLDPHDVS